MSTKTSVTHRDGKGRHLIGIAEAALNGVGLNEEEAQRVSMRGNELKAGFAKLLRDLAAVFNPAKFIGEDWHIDPADEQLLPAPANIDPGTVLFKNMHRSGERSLSGEERIRRHREEGNKHLTADHFLYFWNNKEKIPESWKLTESGETRFILCDGTILRSPGGGRCVLCLYWRGGAWDWDYRWHDDDWRAQDQSAIVSK